MMRNLITRLCIRMRIFIESILLLIKKELINNKYNIFEDLFRNTIK